MKNSYQLDLFCNSDNLYKITKPIRLIEFFAGIGFQRMGIQKAFPNMQSYKICEWAVPSIIAYDAIWTEKRSSVSLSKDELVDQLEKLGISLDYNVPAERKQIERMQLEKLTKIYAAIKDTHNLVNIMNVKGSDLEIVDTDKYEYVVSYSFPCQDLSLAGNGKGMSVSQAEGGTRSGLVWEFLRIIKECENKPQILLMENVPQVHSKDNNGDFYYLQCELQKLGYKNFWQDMNAKNYGVPQNRNRTFMLSIYDKNADYVFPEPEPLKLRLKDLLEENVDEKYYLSEKMVKFISTEDINHQGSLQPALVNKTCSQTITTREGNTRCQESNYICKDLPENADLKQFTNKALNETIEKNELEDGIDISSRMESHRGTVQKGISQTLTCQGGNNVGVVVDDENSIKKGV